MSTTSTPNASTPAASTPTARAQIAAWWMRLAASPLPEWLVLLTAALTRFWRLDYHSIWFDEAVSLAWAASDPDYTWRHVSTGGGSTRRSTTCSYCWQALVRGRPGAERAYARWAACSAC
ncbi:MAG: hypothetical protein R2851_11085 [Caldilineaceae bacterium]